MLGPIFKIKLFSQVQAKWGKQIKAVFPRAQEPPLHPSAWLCQSPFPAGLPGSIHTQTFHCLLDSSELSQSTQIKHIFEDNRLSFPSGRKCCVQTGPLRCSHKHWGFPQRIAALRKHARPSKKCTPSPWVQTLANSGHVTLLRIKTDALEQATAALCCLPYRPPEHLSQKQLKIMTST